MAEKQLSSKSGNKVIEDASDPKLAAADLVSLGASASGDLVVSGSDIRIGLEEFANRHYKGRLELMAAFVLDQKGKNSLFDLEQNYCKKFNEFRKQPVEHTAPVLKRL